MRRQVEMWLRALLLGLTFFLLCSGAWTLMFREPTPAVQFIQILHAWTGIAFVSLGALYMSLHLITVTPGARSALRLLPWRQVIVVAPLLLLSLLLVFPPPLDAHAILNRALSCTAIAITLVFLRFALRAAIPGAQNLVRNGIAALLGSFIAATSGLHIFMLLPNGAEVATRYASPWFWHIVSSILTLFLVLWHIRASRQRAGLDSGGRRWQYQWNGRVPLAAGLVASALGGWAVVGAIGVSARVRPFTADPDALVAVDRGFSATVPSLCEQCHFEVVDGWRTSAHALAADNPVFSAMIRARFARLGGEAVRFCLRCHAPHAADPTRLPLEVVMASEGYHAGVHCMSCHRTAPGPLLRDGSLVGFPRAFDPVTLLIEHTDAEVGFALNRVAMLLVSSRLELHRRTYRFSSHSADSCRPCHIQSFSEPSHGRLDVLLQDQYGSWSTSPAAAQGRDCKGCHLPHYYSNGDYLFADHRFLAASTYVAAVARGARSLVPDVVATLQGQMPAFGRPEDDGAAPGRGPLLDLTVKRAVDGAHGDAFVVSTENRGEIGHSFPNGPTDLLEVWLSIRAVDAAGHVVVDRGLDGPPGALRLGATFEDEAGNPIRDHRLEDVTRIVDGGVIPASGRHEVRIPIDGPAVFPVRVAAAWNYRRLNPGLIAALTGSAIDLPIVRVATFDGEVR